MYASIDPSPFITCSLIFTFVPYNDVTLSSIGALMISRRRFLEVGSIAAGVAATSSSLLGFAKSAQNKIEEQSLPSPIANLKSRKNEATPIQVEERAARLDRARILMTQNAIDAIVLMAGTSLNYFTGIPWGGGGGLFCFFLPGEGGALSCL